MKTASFVAVTLVCAAFWAGPAAAQAVSGTSPVRSDTRGLGIGVQLNGMRVLSDQSRMVPGAGLGLTLSYGTSDALSVFARGSMGYRMSQLDVGARYRLGNPSSALRPYVEASVSRFGALRPPLESTAGESVRAWGLGMTVGAGVEYHVSPRLGLDLGVSHTEGRFRTPTLPGEAAFRETLSSTRFQVGVTWRP